MATDLSIYAADTPLSHLGYWGDAVMTHRYPYGSYELTWSADYPLGFKHPSLTVGATTVAKVGPTKVWRGRLTKVDIAGGAFVAEGTIRQAETALAFGIGGATTDLEIALFFAALRGAVSIGTLEDFSGEMEDLESSNPINYLMDLMVAYAARHDTNLMINPDGVLYKIADPTVPMIKVEPTSGELGIVDENYWSTLTGLYKPTVSTTDLVTSVDASQNVVPREGAVDLTPLGVMTLPQAQATLDSILAKGLARTGWSEPVQVVNGQITNMGGTSVEPWAVALAMATSGVMVRLANMKDPRGVSMSTDVILEETVWNTATDEITLKPRGLEARDLAAVVESLGAQLTI